MDSMADDPPLFLFWNFFKGDVAIIAHAKFNGFLTVGILKWT